MPRRAIKVPIACLNAESARDGFGFSVPPQHLKLYKQYANIYKEEETERSARWQHFLEAHGKPVYPDRQLDQFSGSDHNEAFIEGVDKEKEACPNFEAWESVRSCLLPLECAIRDHLQKRKGRMDTIVQLLNPKPDRGSCKEVCPSYQTAGPSGYASGDSDNESEEEFYDVERSDMAIDSVHGSTDPLNEIVEQKEPCLWREELDALVRGGVPMAFRGEVWQVFVGSSTCRLQKHYESLLNVVEDSGSAGGVLEKWSSQIDKDFHMTFRGHTALDEDGMNALRRVLIVYAQINSGVVYSQALTLFAALLVLMMPEENAFWTLTCMINNCFEGYYSEEKLESQVDQLVLEDLVRSHFPRLVAHLDNLGVKMGWVTGPWLLSAFLNVLPWESALRVWDVLLYERGRAMLFRTALALLELHGSSIITEKDAGNIVALLQSCVGTTFDSSLLVLTACMGYQSVNEEKLQELRSKYYPQVLSHNSDITSNFSVSEKFRSFGFSQQLEKGSDHCNNVVTFTSENGTALKEHPQDEAFGQGIDTQGLPKQVELLKMQLSRALEERRAAMLREEELETAFMELVKEDNRRLLSARVEMLEIEIAHLKQVIADKEQQEHVVVQVVTRMEHEQHLTNDARRAAEEVASAQKAALKDLKAKYDAAFTSLKAMEKRALMAESMLEATLQSQGLVNGHVSSPRQLVDSIHEEQSPRWSWPWNTSKSIVVDASLTRLFDSSHRKSTIPQSFSLAWRERPKGKVSSQKASTSEDCPPESPQGSLGYSSTLTNDTS